MAEEFSSWHEYECKAIEEIQKVNPNNGYYPYLQKVLEYIQEATKKAEKEQEEVHFQIIDSFFLDNVIDAIIDLVNVLDFRELEEYSSYQESEMLKVNLKYRKDIVDIIAFISQVYEKHIPGTIDEQYTKHILMFYIKCLCINNWVVLDSGNSEFIGLNFVEKKPYLQLFDKLKSEGIDKIDFTNKRYMYFRPNSLSIDRESIDEFRAKKTAWVNQNRQSTQGGCYIATAVYGSYDCPEVWVLRRFRDNWLSSRFWGRLFIRMYYKTSPTIVRLFGKDKWFNHFWRSLLDKFTVYLKQKGFSSDKYYD